MLRCSNVKLSASNINKKPKECYWNSTTNLLPLRALYLAAKQDISDKRAGNENAVTNEDIYKFLGINIDMNHIHDSGS